MTKDQLKELTKDDLIEVINEQQNTIDDMNSVIEELQAENKSTGPKKQYIKIGKKKCQVITPAFMHNGRRYTIDDLRQNKDLQQEILKIKGQKIIKTD